MDLQGDFTMVNVFGEIPVALPSQQTKHELTSKDWASKSEHLSLRTKSAGRETKTSQGMQAHPGLGVALKTLTSFKQGV